MSPSPGRRLRDLLVTAAPVLTPGAADALGARIVADAGFDAVFVSGAGIANWSFGVPDLRLTTRDDVVRATARICDAVDVPVVVDADSGYGSALGVRRTVQALERAGVAAIELEDQVDPPRNGRVDDREVVPRAVMLGTLRAALDARRDTDLVIVARTDARVSEGLDAAIDRACAYREAGADVVFVDTPYDRSELARIGAEVPGPKVANMIEGGLTPIVGRDELGRLGFALVLYAGLAGRAAMKAMQATLARLAADGITTGVADRIVTMAERNRLTGMDAWRALDDRYREG